MYVYAYTTDVEYGKRINIAPRLDFFRICDILTLDPRNAFFEVIICIPRRRHRLSKGKESEVK